MTSFWNQRNRITAVAAVAFMATFATTDAASPTFWRVSTQEEFLRGDVKNLSIDSDGQLLLGPSTETVYETTSPFLWTVVATEAGLLIGSGRNGQVLRVAPNGSAITVFEADQLNVHAVAPAPDGSVYIGTSPDGVVLRVQPDGESTTIFDPEEKYIWALAFDRMGTLFVATGNTGRIYRVEPDGTWSLFYDTKATHVLALAFDAENNLLAGTGGPGWVFRISPEGQAFVLVDTEYEEVRAVRPGQDGVIYAVAMSQVSRRGSSAPMSPMSAQVSAPTVSVTTEVQAIAIADVNGRARVQSVTNGGETKAAGRGAVFRIEPDGIWNVVWRSNEDAPYDIALGQDGGFLVGTGNDGKVFQVAGVPPRVVLLARATAQQVTRFSTGADGHQYYITSNPGRLYRFANAQSAEGTYLSEVRDAETVATWGTLRWRARTPGDSVVSFFTRSGNTEVPNSTWSPWSDGYANSDGSQITSPKARYLQWKAVLSGVQDRPALQSVTTSYLPHNLRPEFASLTVYPPGIVFQQPFTSGEPPIAGFKKAVNPLATGNGTNSNGDAQPATLGRQAYRKGLQTFVWAASDPNGDELLFDVHYRMENESVWHTLRPGVNDSIFTWDTTSTPDGSYLVRIGASDELFNAPDTALTGTLESVPFDIDNSAPVIEVDVVKPQGEQSFVTFVVRDAYSPVRYVEYSVDTERWQVLYPVDGIADSRMERFEVVLKAETVERLVIRATDAMNNVSTAAAR
jgi:hypothetical protein